MAMRSADVEKLKKTLNKFKLMGLERLQKHIFMKMHRRDPGSIKLFYLRESDFDNNGRVKIRMSALTHTGKLFQMIEDALEVIGDKEAFVALLEETTIKHQALLITSEHLDLVFESLVEMLQHTLQFEGMHEAQESWVKFFALIRKTMHASYTLEFASFSETSQNG
eukprot:TRINITY_DN64546_c0_g1_i1.p1 TRINITY_DN64546_c0_g1~~TRINITY_DN64546_c0_g1_i1.p1  ORF type:complete len:166 (+),score=36.32 TRINITY_DN64546_c0_g1_i1:161-658(+)